MFWNICGEIPDFFLTVNGKRCVGESGKANVIHSCTSGNSKDEIWFKLAGENQGKRLNRSNIEASNEMLATAISNSQFLDVLQEMGVVVVRRTRKTHTIDNRRDVLVEPVPVPEPTGVPDNLLILREKSAGSYRVALTDLTEPIDKFTLRDVDLAWVKKIKENIKRQPSAPVTRIPVLYTKEEITPAEFNIEDLEQPLQTLGGNHMVLAMKDILREERLNPHYDCLRHVDVEVFVNLSSTEALFVSSWHNSRCEQKSLTFQDKVKIGRRIFQKGEENWKDEVVVVLGDLDRKNYRKESLSTVLSVAAYMSENWEATERLLAAAGDTSSTFPQNIFRQLQGLDDNLRTPYLLKAIGSNGIKVSHQIAADKRKDHLRKIAVSALDEESWDDMSPSYILAEDMLNYTGDVNNPDGRQRYVKHLTELARNENESFTVNITVMRNGQQLQIGQEIIDKYSNENHKGTAEK